MPDRDAIRARIKAFVTTLPDNIPQHAMAFIAAEFVSDCTALLAALDKAEERLAYLRERNAVHNTTENVLRRQVRDAEARADAAERRGERMLAAVVAASHTVIPDHGAEWMNGFAAGQRAMRAALARAARAPCAKKRYRNRAIAERARASIERWSEAPMRVYGCPDCGGFHITSKVYRRRDGESETR